MSLSQQDIAELKQALKDLPLASESPRFVEDLAAYMARSEVNAGHVILDPNVPVGYLYLLAGGSITETMGTSGQPWYQKELKPGDFLGQRSLRSGKHESRAVATTSPTVVYSIHASALAPLLDSYPDFWDVLWKETLVSRLRSLPLFERLSDSEVNWLAELVEEVPLDGGADVPLNQKQGLWLVDWGQIAVTGPAAKLPSLQIQASGSSPAPEPEWTITAGNFVFTLQQGTRFGGACAALGARAARDSKMLFLDDKHFNRMLAAVYAVRPMTDAPLDIPARLAQVPLFRGKGMTPEHQRHLAQFCAWAFVPANQNISIQGAPGFSFVYMLKGGAVATAIDDRGRARPVHLLQFGDSYGETSLLESTRRDATVRAVPGPGESLLGTLTGAEILHLDRRDLEVAFDERPDLWHSGVELYEKYKRIQAAKPRYDWLDEGEHVEWASREHWYTITEDLVGEGFLVVLALVALDFVLARLGAGPTAIVLADLLILALLVLPAVAYTVWNYRETYYVVTNRRVTRRDIQFVISEERIDAPLESVQDVTYSQNFAGRVFGFGDVTIRTAAKVGSIVFRHVPAPEEVNDRVPEAKAAALVATRGYTKETLRRGLLSDLGLALTVPDLDASRALGENAGSRAVYTLWQRLERFLLGRASRPRVLPARRRVIPGWLRAILSLVLRGRARKVLLGPEPRQRKLAPGEIVWRKHWVDLLQRGGSAFPIGALLLLVGIGLVALSPALGNDFIIFFLAWVVLMIFVIPWMAYVGADWWNDQYIVTDESIIDIEKKPLALSSVQRQSSLGTIQTVKSDQPSIWSKILNYGDVQVRTAAADEGFTFKTVPKPMIVQRTVFEKADAYRQKQEQKRVEDRRRDIMEGVAVYHDMKENQGKTRWP